MQNLKNIPKQYLIFGGVILVLVIVIVVIMTQTQSVSTVQDKDTVFEEAPELIPTVDSSVRASITGNKEGVIKITGVPRGTKEIEYELSYSTKTGSIEGVFGTIKIKDSTSSVEEEITFGTCSSGTCRYHAIDGPVKGTFKFSGSYGQKILEKEFEV